MTHHLDCQVVRLTSADIDWATILLCAAFRDEPPVSHLFTGVNRERQIAAFLRGSCQYAMHYGEAYTTSTHQGIALWLPPGETTITLMKMLRSGTLLAPLRLGLQALPKFMSFMQLTHKVHKASAPMDHYYLLMLGVHPLAQGKGIGKLLMNHLLERARQESMPVYLETQREQNLDLYRRFGFNVTLEASAPDIKGLTNWGMLRAKA